jgi:hypothetical protein
MLFYNVGAAEFVVEDADGAWSEGGELVAQQDMIALGVRSRKGRRSFGSRTPLFRHMPPLRDHGPRAVSPCHGLWDGLAAHQP